MRDALFSLPRICELVCWRTTIQHNTEKHTQYAALDLESAWKEPPPPTDDAAFASAPLITKRFALHSMYRPPDCTCEYLQRFACTFAIYLSFIIRDDQPYLHTHSSNLLFFGKTSNCRSLRSLGLRLKEHHCCTRWVISRLQDRTTLTHFQFQAPTLINQQQAARMYCMMLSAFGVASIVRRQNYTTARIDCRTHIGATRRMAHAGP